MLAAPRALRVAPLFHTLRTHARHERKDNRHVSHVMPSHVIASSKRKRKRKRDLNSRMSPRLAPTSPAPTQASTPRLAHELRSQASSQSRHVPRARTSPALAHEHEHRRSRDGLSMLRSGETHHHDIIRKNHRATLETARRGPPPARVQQGRGRSSARDLDMLRRSSSNSSSSKSRRGFLVGGAALNLGIRRARRPWR